MCKERNVDRVEEVEYEIWQLAKKKAGVSDFSLQEESTRNMSCFFPNLIIMGNEETAEYLNMLNLPGRQTERRALKTTVRGAKNPNAAIKALSR